MTAIPQAQTESVKLLVTLKTGWRKKTKQGNPRSRKAKVQVINSSHQEFIGREFWLILHWRLADTRIIPPMCVGSNYVLRAVIDTPNKDRLHLKSKLDGSRTTNKCLYAFEVKE